MRKVTISVLPVVIVAMGLLFAGTAPAGTPEYRVGSGCTYSTIQDAVDAISNQGSGIIRIRSGTYTENLAVVDKTVDLLGGHDDCSTDNASGSTHVDASGNTSPAIAFLVTGGPSGSSHALTTDKLNVFEGTGNSLVPAGGNGTIRVSDSLVRANEAASGDYGLRTKSPAIDVCDAAMLQPSHGLGGKERGIDAPEVGNEVINAWPYDLGAYSLIRSCSTIDSRISNGS